MIRSNDVIADDGVAMSGDSVPAFRILHISDLHERAPFLGMPEKRKALLRLDQEERGYVLGPAFLTALQDVASIGVDLVCFTGDTADWARPEEFAAASARFNTILATLGVPKARFFAIPGNHDVQRTVHPTAWKRLQQWHAKTRDSRSIGRWFRMAAEAPAGARPVWREQVLGRTASFWDWMAAFGRPELQPTPPTLLGYRYTFPRGTFGQLPTPVHVIGLDSAWLSGDKHDQGRLLVTEEQVLAHVRDGATALEGLRVALIHHPLDHLADHHEVRRLLADAPVDLVLHGHQHTPLALITDEPGARLRVLAAGCLMEGDMGKHWPNGFQLIEIDRHGAPDRVHFRKWSARGHFWALGSDIYRDAPAGILDLRPTAATAARVSLDRLPGTGGDFIGRHAELRSLDDAWADFNGTHAVALVAPGGVGKTSLVKRWLDVIRHDGWRGARRVYGWSFYSQGTRIDHEASEDPFLDSALRWFGIDHDSTLSAPDKARLLSEALARDRTLLVLDGIEPLQYPPGPLAGRLRARGLDTLLHNLLSNGHPGLCIITSRETLTDLREYERTADRPAGPLIKFDVGNLSEEDGGRLLYRLGVRRAGPALIRDEDDELREASREVLNHALALTLLGRFLALAHRGDIRRRDQVRFEEADAETLGGHAFRIMRAYERWLGDGDDSGRRALATCRLLGLFDRPADAECLASLRRPPVIKGLTDPLFDRVQGRQRQHRLAPITDLRWSLTAARLVECGLLLPSDHESDGTLDAHPLVREYFAAQLRNNAPLAWKQAHRRLYEHLTTSAPYRPEGLAALQPLYQAVAHGCHAGLHDQAHSQIFVDRILRGEGPGGFYSTKQLGAIGADLGAVACFFETPWTTLVPTLTKEVQAWLAGIAGYCLRAMGRLTEAVDPTRMALNAQIDAVEPNWGEAAIYASNLSELELMLGRITSAAATAESSVVYADRSEDAFRPMVNRATLGDALHQAGRHEDARRHFDAAKALQAQRQPQYPLLYSLPGFWYSDLLMAPAERIAARRSLAGSLGHGDDHGSELTSALDELAAVERRMETIFSWRQGRQWVAAKDPLLDVALDHLTVGRAALYRALLGNPPVVIPGRGNALDVAREHVGVAVNHLRTAGATHHLARGLLTRAWLRATEGLGTAAEADLNEVWRVASRGAMRLYMADALLSRARLFRDGGSLASARAIVQECGYRRRADELADAERAAADWSGGRPAAGLSMQ